MARKDEFKEASVSDHDGEESPDFLVVDNFVEFFADSDLLSDECLIACRSES